jgi:hypothetical protein
MMSKGTLAVLLALLMVLVASGILVSAADAAVPGDWMYGVDRAMDGLRLSLALDPKQKAQVEIQLAQERLREAQTLTRRGETENVAWLRQESRQALQAAKTAAPFYARKTEKSFVSPVQVTDPYCTETDSKHHPLGEKLAQRLDASYLEVMTWYCQGYKFSEIAQAYRISRAAGVAVDELFTQRSNGVSWSEILKMYGLNGKLEKDKLRSSS